MELKMKSFKKFLSEDIDYGMTRYVTSGKMPDDDATEHSFFAEIPSKTAPEGKTNLWMAKVSSHDGESHEFHFGINPDIQPHTLRQRQQELSKKENRQVAPHEAFYSFGMTEADQNKLEYHGPETMLHVIHHFTNLFNALPDGNKVTLHTGDDSKVEPEIRDKKLRMYRKITERALRSGGGRILSSPEDPHVIIQRDRNIKG